MGDDRQKAAEAALASLTAREVQQVLSLLCADRPEAVLAAVQRWHEHSRLIATLLQREPPADAAAG